MYVLSLWYLLAIQLETLRRQLDGAVWSSEECWELTLGITGTQMIFKIITVDQISQGVTIVRKIISALQDLMVRTSRWVLKREGKEWAHKRRGKPRVVLFQKPKDKKVSREDVISSQTVLRESVRWELNCCHHKKWHLSPWRSLLMMTSGY